MGKKAHTNNAVQKAFDAQWITASEICERVGITRMALSLASRQLGRMPECAVMGKPRSRLWLRSDMEPFLRTWKKSLAQQRAA